ncbi:MAG: DNA repair protein RecO [Chloroflexi bacterium]|nr:DNA repair protein RecO [Chloroflexota bacterium]
MSRERVYRVDALILKRADMGEADRLLTIYTPARGKLRVVAKGARKPQSRKSGHVELFTHVNLQIARGRSLDIVTQAEIIDPFLALRGDLSRTAYAYYAAELVDQFAEEEQANPAVFDLLRDAFGWIGQTGDLWLTTRFLEMHLLAFFGYQPQLHNCVLGDEPIEPVDNYFDAAQGGVLCPRHGEALKEARPLSLNALKALRFMQSREYAEVMRVQFGAPTRAEVEAVMQRYIQHVLERRLKSTDFLRLLERTS